MTVCEQNKKKKEYLRRYSGICNRIKTLEAQIKELRETKESAKAVTYSDMPKGNKQSDLSDYMVKIETLEKKVGEKICEKKIEKLNIESYIAELENDIESEVLYKRYIESKTWKEIAAEFGCGERNVQRYHGEALKHLKIDI